MSATRSTCTWEEKRVWPVRKIRQIRSQIFSIFPLRVRNIGTSTLTWTISWVSSHRLSLLFSQVFINHSHKYHIRFSSQRYRMQDKTEDFKNRPAGCRYAPRSRRRSLAAPQLPSVPIYAQGRIGASHASAASNWLINSRRTASSECNCLIAVKAWKKIRKRLSV